MGLRALVLLHLRLLDLLKDLRVLGAWPASSGVTEAPFSEPPPSHHSTTEPSTTSKASVPPKTSPFEAASTPVAYSPPAGVATKDAGPPAQVTVIEITTVTAIATETTTVDSTLSVTTVRV